MTLRQVQGWDPSACWSTFLYLTELLGLNGSTSLKAGPHCHSVAGQFFLLCLNATLVKESCSLCKGEIKTFTLPIRGDQGLIHDLANLSFSDASSWFPR